MQDKSIISKIIETEIPEKLCHYTSSKGLMGIIDTGKIRATKIQYMNDGSELQHGFKHIRKEIEVQKQYIRHEMEVQDGYKKRSGKELNDMLSALDHIEMTNICVASFTKEEDQLSQWRGYCKIGDGYTLCFDGKKLLESVEKLPEYIEKLPEWVKRKPVCYLVPCNYKEADHRKMAKELISSAFFDKEQCNPNPNAPLLRRLIFEEAALFIAAMIKAKGFEEEKEWRLICGPVLSNVFEYRSGKYALIPYLELDLDLKNALKKIIIGPTPEPELSKRAIHGYLTKVYSVDPHGIPPVKPENSKISWKSI